MREVIEIRWHGRGGQGAVTAAKLLAEAALREGKHIQAFPEYGPERTGAPVKSFNRISTKPILRHCHVTNPQIVAVLDPTLIDVVDVAGGIPPGGAIIVNTSLSPAELKNKLDCGDIKVFTVDATKISIDKLGRNIPNTPMIGALVKVSGVIKLESLVEAFKDDFGAKLNTQALEGNIAAIRAAHDEVKN